MPHAGIHFFNAVKIPSRALATRLAARLAARLAGETLDEPARECPLDFLRARRQNSFSGQNEHIETFHDFKSDALGMLLGHSGDVLGTLRSCPGSCLKNVFFSESGTFGDALAGAPG